MTCSLSMCIHQRYQPQQSVIVPGIVQQTELQAMQLVREVEDADGEAMLCTLHVVERARGEAHKAPAAAHTKIRGRKDYPRPAVPARGGSQHAPPPPRSARRTSRNGDALERSTRTRTDAGNGHAANPSARPGADARDRDAGDVAACARANAPNDKAGDIAARARANSAHNDARHVVARAHAQPANHETAQRAAGSKAESGERDARHIISGTGADARERDAANAMACANANRRERESVEITFRVNANAGGHTRDVPCAGEWQADRHTAHHALRRLVRCPERDVHTLYADGPVVPEVQAQTRDVRRVANADAHMMHGEIEVPVVACGAAVRRGSLWGKAVLRAQ